MNRVLMILGLAVAAIPVVVSAQTQPYNDYVQQTYPQAQQPAQVQPPVQPAPQPQYAPQAVGMSPAQLDQVAGPIALYPDVLLGQVLTASIHPAEVAQANQFVRAYPQAAEPFIDAQPWDPSVKALVHYPTVLAALANDPNWMQSIGGAYSYQPVDLMNSVQRLRYAAYNAGALTSTPQQQVLFNNGAIQIQPIAQTVYVPVYNPQVVYVRQPVPMVEPIRFSFGVTFGGWDNCSIDWRTRVVERPRVYVPAPRVYLPPPPVYRRPAVIITHRDPHDFDRPAFPGPRYDRRDNDRHDGPRDGKGDDRDNGRGDNPRGGRGNDRRDGPDRAGPDRGGPDRGSDHRNNDDRRGVRPDRHDGPDRHDRDDRH